MLRSPIKPQKNCGVHEPVRMDGVQSRLKFSEGEVYSGSMCTFASVNKPTSAQGDQVVSAHNLR